LLSRLTHLLATGLHWLGAFVALPLLVVLIGLDVVLRYVFGAPLGWGQEVDSLLLLFVFVLGLPQCAVAGSHIRMDLVAGRLRPMGKRVATVAAQLCALLFAVPLAWRSAHDVPGMYRRGEGAELIDIPYWPIALVLCICAVFLCLHALGRIAAALRGAEDAG